MTARLRYRQSCAEQQTGPLIRLTLQAFDDGKDLLEVAVN